MAKANTFKPHRATYEQAPGICGVRMAEVLLVANCTLGCIGVKAAGMRTAFIKGHRV